MVKAQSTDNNILYIHDRFNPWKELNYCSYNTIGMNPDNSLKVTVTEHSFSAQLPQSHCIEHSCSAQFLTTIEPPFLEIFTLTINFMLKLKFQNKQHTYSGTDEFCTLTQQGCSSQNKHEVYDRIKRSFEICGRDNYSIGMVNNELEVQIRVMLKCHSNIHAATENVQYCGKCIVCTEDYMYSLLHSKQYNIVGIPTNLLHLLITFI